MATPPDWFDDPNGAEDYHQNPPPVNPPNPPPVNPPNPNNASDEGQNAPGANDQNPDPVQGPSSVYLLNGYLEDFTHRKRLIWIRRFFSEPRVGETASMSNYSQSYLTGAKYDSPTFEKVSADTRIEWLDWMTPYLSDESLAKLKTDYKGKADKWQNFAVVIGSLPYYSWNDFNHRHSDNINTMFGMHRVAGRWVFVSYNGEIRSVLLYCVSPDKIFLSKPAGFSATFPVIRHLWHDSDEELTLGLIFGPNKNGDRFYNRFDDKRFITGRVFEIREQDLDKFKQSIGKQPYVAIYICAGGKLMLCDNCHHDSLDQRLRDKHNRSLIQQGGIVICVGNLVVTTPWIPPNKLIPGDQTHETYIDQYNRFERYSWSDFCKRHVSYSYKSKNSSNNNFNDFTQPVLFLGGIESDRSAVAWELNVRRSGTIELLVPLHQNQWTPITAVSNGRSGLDEISARIHYEILHDSVVSRHTTQFWAPADDQSLKDFLNVDCLRFLSIQYSEHMFYKNRDRTQFGLSATNPPAQFNLSRIKTEKKGFYSETPGLIRRQQTRASQPPMFPPLFEYDNRAAHMYYWPCLEKQIEKFDTHYGPDSTFKVNGTIYKSCLAESQVYHFERCQEKEKQFNPLPGHQNRNTPEEVYRIGSDGWMWKKKDPQPMSQYQIQFGMYQESIICFRKPLDTTAQQNQGAQSRGSQSRGAQSRGSQSRGGQSLGSQNYGGQHSGGQNRGGQNQGGQNRGGQNRGGPNRGGQNRGGQNRGGQPRGRNQNKRQ